MASDRRRGDAPLAWIVLTMGDRPDELLAAVESLGDATIVIANGVGSDATSAEIGLGESSGVDVIGTDSNLGVPGGRDLGVRSSDADVLGFLDDDAVATPDISTSIVERFRADPQLGGVALRIVDDAGHTVRRHVPRFGSRDPERSGPVALFLGGACALRRSAYEDVGGYFTDLVYGHEEVELAWRLVDAGWTIEYLADAVVQHPRTEISRHAHGWELTGRNRVWIAVRTLPRPLSWLHALAWLGLGAHRTPDAATRRAYVSGWRSGWATAPRRSPISWRGVWRLTRLGRPPIL